MGKDSNFAKITPPRVAGVVTRRRLLDQLEPGGEASAVWIAGAPGSGKTTLAGDRLRQGAAAGLWYRLDPSDEDLASFFHYLALAARQAAPRRRFRLPALTPEYSAGTEAFAHELFRRLYSRLPAPFVLVLDDYHVLSGKAALHDILPIMVEEMPHQGLLVVASRERPPATLARHGAIGRLRRLDESELRFTPEETRALLGLLDSRAAAETLQARTRGWAAGLVLMAAMDEPIDTEQRLPEVLFDYFTQEILDGIEPASRRLLAAASVLSEVPPAVIRALAENQTAGGVFEWLARRNLFVYRHRERDPVYEFHPLFREFLMAHAGELMSREALTAAWRRAAACLEVDDPDQAIWIHIRLADWDAVTRLVQDAAPRRITEGRSHTVAGWLDAVPEATVRSRPWLSYWRGLSRLHDNPLSAAAVLETAFERFKEQAEGEGVWLSWAGLMEARFLAQRDITGLAVWTARYPDLIRRYPDMSRRLRARVALAMSIGLIYGETGHPDAAYWSREASRRAILTLDPESGLKAYQLRIALAAWQGRFDEARRLVRHLRRLERVLDAPPVVRLMVDIGDALVAVYTLAYPGAMEITARSEALAGRHGVHVLDGHILGIGANAAVEAGELEEAGRRLERLAPVAETERHNEAAYYFNVAALHALAKGAVERALALAGEARERIALSGMPLGRFTVAATEARVLQGAGHPQAAVEAARRAQALSGALNSPYTDFGAGLLLADVLCDIDREEADQHLAEAFRVGRRHGFAGSVFIGLAAHGRLCVRSLQAGIESDYARQLARELPLDATGVSAGLAEWPWPVRVHVLGRFEVECDGESLTSRGRTQRKPLEMLAALVCEGDRGLSGAALADLLWPEAEGDAARRSLDTTLHRLRRLLGRDDAVTVGEGRVVANSALVWSDLAAAEALMSATESAAEKSRKVLIDNVEQLLRIYRGPLLTDYAWATRHRLAQQARFTRWIDDCCRRIAEANGIEQAMAVCERALEREPYAEPLYHTLMRVTVLGGDHSDVRAAHERCRRVFRDDLGTEPSEELDRLLAKLTARPVPARPTVVSEARGATESDRG